MNDFILKTDDLSKRYGEQLAVGGVCLKIRRNCVYGLLGPNGAGKSTTLKMITGLLRPDVYKRQNSNGRRCSDGQQEV